MQTLLTYYPMASYKVFHAFFSFSSPLYLTILPKKNHKYFYVLHGFVLKQNPIDF